jgi:hypothetical protein
VSCSRPLLEPSRLMELRATPGLSAIAATHICAANSDVFLGRYAHMPCLGCVMRNSLCFIIVLIMVGVAVGPLVLLAPNVDICVITTPSTKCIPPHS